MRWEADVEWDGLDLRSGERAKDPVQSGGELQSVRSLKSQDVSWDAWP